MTLVVGKRKQINNGAYTVYDHPICLVSLQSVNIHNQLSQNSCPPFPRTQLIRITHALVARTGTKMAFFKVSVGGYKMEILNVLTSY